MAEEAYQYTWADYTSRLSPSLSVFSFLNGFYEELFFMGLVMATQVKYLRHAIVYSLFVRFIFHLYQGIAGASTILTLGFVFLLWRKKVNSLVPFMLAHAYFDLFGLGLPYQLLFD
ncbi:MULTISPECIES: CPBP family intramembrane glutamic endopeptidase [unclassified Acinetobacter]|uniref:CPBP family intramembrane glutamic endopeptidase n=1 Tax=unclassified Acinetobacter TaxID=196816 RepID=UPI0035B7F00F